MASLKIKDFMITDVITAKKNDKIIDLLQLLVANRIGGVPVTDDNGTLLGMISDGDVIRYLQPKGRTVYDMYALILVNEKENLQEKLEYSIDQPIKKMMKKRDVYSVKPEDELEKALEILAQNSFKKIPVVDGENRVIGVLSRGDLVRYITNKLID